MDGLLLENSLCTTQDEYNEIIKDKEKVADIFFINYFGFLSMYAIGLRGDIKRYKSEEASLYPKYLGLDNKDVSLSVKMIFDAKVTQGSVTTRMTKLLAKIKGNMIKPSDIDDTMIKDLLLDSRLTTTSKPSVKIRNIMQQWVDGEFAIEWLAFYLYKVARLPEYKDITKEFVSMYKTGQYAQSYSNILNGSRKKHTGSIPKEFQNNNPIDIAKNAQGQDQADTVDSNANTVSKEDFMAIFKKAIEAEKNKNTSDAVGDAVNTQIDNSGDTVNVVDTDTVKFTNGVPDANNTEYDRHDDAEHAPATEVEIEEINIAFAGLLTTLHISSTGKLEYILPVAHRLVLDQETIADAYDEQNANYLILHLASEIKEHNLDWNSTKGKAFLESASNAIYEMFEMSGIAPTYYTQIQVDRVLTELAYLMIIRYLADDKNIASELFQDKYLPERIYDKLANVTTQDIQQAFILADVGKADGFNKRAFAYLIKMLENVRDGVTDFNSNTFAKNVIAMKNICITFTPIDMNGTEQVILYDVIKYYLVSDSDVMQTVQTILTIVTECLLTGKLTWADTFALGVQTLFNFTGKFTRMLGDFEVLLLDDFKTFFREKSKRGHELLDYGRVDIGEGMYIVTRIEDSQFVNDGNIWIKVAEAQKIYEPTANSLITTGNIYSTFGRLDDLMYANFVTDLTPHGLKPEMFKHELVEEFLLEILKRFNSSVGEQQKDSGYLGEIPSQLVTRMKFGSGYGSDKLIALKIAMYIILFNGDADAYYRIESIRSTDVAKAITKVRALIDGFNKYGKEYLTDSYYTGFINRLIEIIKGAFAEHILEDALNDTSGIQNNRHGKNQYNDLFITNTAPESMNEVAQEIVAYMRENKPLAMKFFSHGTTILNNRYPIYGIVNNTFDQINPNFLNLLQEMLDSGEITIKEVHPKFIIRLIDQDKINGDQINTLIDDIHEYIENYKGQGYNLEMMRFDPIARAVMRGVDGISTDKLQNLCDFWVKSNWERRSELSSSVTHQANNIAFTRCLTDLSCDVMIPSKQMDIILKCIYRQEKENYATNDGINNAILQARTVLKCQDPELFENYMEHFLRRNNKNRTFEYNEKTIRTMFDVKSFKYTTIEAQKLVIDILAKEINRKKLSSFMLEDGGLEMYTNLLIDLLDSVGQDSAEQVEKLITPTRLKTIMINSAIHNIDYDKMQKDLNNGIINTPAILGRDRLMKLAKLNGITIKREEIKFPRGVKAFDIIRHMKGEIKLVDNFEVELSDIPFEEVEHTEDTIRRENACIWHNTRNKHHQNQMPIFEKEFRPTRKTNNVDTFLAEHPETKVLDLAFHGTGRIAGAYIVRYGFADVDGDVGVGVAGKALGNGIYVAIHYNKSGIYLTDYGYTWDAGKHDGYLFKVRVALGRLGVHHQYGGPDTKERWDAPEWCVKYPTKQIDILSIYKCHSVTRAQAHKLLGEYV